jgi:hypothetical protein
MTPSALSTDPFASNIVSQTLSWIVCIPALLGVVTYIISVFLKQEDIPWWFSTWVGLCFLVLSPIRYMLFQLVTATSYPFQSVFAFFSVCWLGFFAPFAFALLYAIGFGLPLLLTFLIVGRRPRWWRYLLVSLAAPLIAILASVAFGFALPFAALTTHWLRAEDVIRATNGPSYYAFSWFAPARAIAAVPPYFPKTPRTARDYLRTHVAFLYLSEREQQRFATLAYPELATDPAAVSRVQTTR